jgi:hypothetical protein
MEKTQEQNDTRLQEITKNFIEQLKGEYKDCSAVISVNNGEVTICLIHGSTFNLINNVERIEENEAYQKVKKAYQKMVEFEEALQLAEED